MLLAWCEGRTEGGWTKHLMKPAAKAAVKLPLGNAQLPVLVNELVEPEVEPEQAGLKVSKRISKGLLEVAQIPVVGLLLGRQ